MSGRHRRRGWDALHHELTTNLTALRRVFTGRVWHVKTGATLFTLFAIWS